MADNPSMKHNHSDDDIIIRDKDGTFKILVDGKFVPLTEAEQKAHQKEHGGPKRAPEFKEKPKPVFKPQVKAEDNSQFLHQKEEVAGFRDKMLEQKARDVIKKSGVTFASSELVDRATKALIPQLKGVRKSFQTKQNLEKPVAQGGAGLDPQDAERIMMSIDGKPADHKPAIDVQKTKKPESMLKPMPAPMAHDVKPPEKIAAAIIPQQKAKDEEKKEPTKPVQAPEPALRDIKRNMPKAAIGPIQELAYSLADWRRLGENPKDRIKKIMSQLDVLEQDSYADRLSGIQAWHDSEVVDLYEKSGLESLEKGTPVEELLGSGGPAQLSFLEWKAIAQLDQDIRA